MLHQLIRYRPVLDVIARGGYGSVLEVGSGSAGIARFCGLKVVGLDMDFMDYTSRRRESPPNLLPVIGDAAALPFRDREFDLVFSCDMVEHVPPASRADVVREMLRVAGKTVVLVFPSGRAASLLDGALLWACRAAGKRAPGWLEEHVALGLPTGAEAKSIVDDSGLTCKIDRNGFIPLHYASVVLESNMRMRDALSGLSLCAISPSGGGFKGVLGRAVLALADIPPAYRVSVVIEKTGRGSR